MAISRSWISLGDIGKIPDGVTTFRKQRQRIAVLKQNGEIIKVFKDNCPHNPKIMISDDYIIKEETITCRFHGACFNLKNGETVKGPGRDGLVLYKYQITDKNKLEILLN